MIPDPAVLLLLVFVGGLVGADSTSVGQFMISRPVVAATVGGLLVGDPQTGALVGLILEALNLTVLPVGAARYPEGGPPALATGAVLAAGPTPPAVLLVGVVFALSWAWVSGWSIRKMREFNVGLMSPGAMDADLPDRLQRRHIAAIGVDFLRGAILVAVAIPLLAVLVELTRASWGLDQELVQVLLWSATAAGIAALVRLFGERRIALFAAGLAGGVLSLVLLR